MKLGLVRAPALVAVAAPAPKRSIAFTWEAAVRRWLWDRSAANKPNLDDVAQEVFIRFSGYNDTTLMKCPPTFVLKVAANVVDEWCGTPRNEWMDDDELPAKQRSTAKKEKRPSVSRGLAKRLQAMVDTLPSRQRQVLLMHVNEGLTYQQIGQKLGMTPGIVRKDLVRAYARIRGDLGERTLDRI